MAENSKISWTDHTMNFWIGCTKVSEGCKNCYAEVDTFARTQRSHGRELWGPSADRHRTSAANWRKPLTWNNNAEWVECEFCGWRGHMKDTLLDGCGNEKCPEADCLVATRQRIFCQSLSDICEDHPKILSEWRWQIASIVRVCSNLDFLFLTKRPENFNRLWLEPFGKLPNNLWVGTTVENQKAADERIPELLKINSKVRFLSCEPLLGHIGFNASTTLRNAMESKKIHWVIAGGESGSKARPMNKQYALSLRDQCKEAGIPFHFKQWGTYDDDGAKVGKNNSGRLLDGVEYNEFPRLDR